MNNLNIDENIVNKLKDMMNNGDLNNVISQIPPDMLKNFSSMISGSNENSHSKQNSTNHNNQGNNQQSNNFDFSNIDMNTIIKMKSVMEKLNNKNDPSSNLLYSLKPYLRESRKDKLDQYANLLNVAKIAGILKDENNENKNNG